MRIRGRVVATPKGFDFVGAFECADTDCAESTKGTFARKGTSFVGLLPSNGKQITVTVRPAK